MDVDQKSHVFSSGVCSNSKFAGFNEDRTQLAMSQLSPLLEPSADMHASSGGISSHNCMQTAVAASEHLACCPVSPPPEPKGPAAGMQCLSSHVDAKMSLIHARSDPSPPVDMPRVTTGMFTRGVLGNSSKTFLHQNVPEGSVAFAPQRCESMPNEHTLPMTSKHCPPQSGAAGVGGVGAQQGLGEAAFAAGGVGGDSHQQWLHPQRRSVDAPVTADQASLGGISRTQVRLHSTLVLPLPPSTRPLPEHTGWPMHVHEAYVCRAILPNGSSIVRAAVRRSLICPRMHA